VRSSPLKRSGMDHTAFTLKIHHTCLIVITASFTLSPFFEQTIYCMLVCRRQCDGMNDEE